MTSMEMLLIKILVGAALIGGAFWYVSSLRHEIETQGLTIATLQAEIALKDAAILAAGKEKTDIEEAVEYVNKEYKKVYKELVDLKGSIGKRPVSATCEQAVGFLGGTASEVANKWNDKK